MLDALRISLPITSVEEVARWVREDRERGRWPMYVFLPQVHANARVSAQS
jgi:hypothetical protein